MVSMHPAPRHSGFSLIEALVGLAIGGMALAIIFSIGTKAGDTGFGLGRRAMAAADSELAVGDLRTVLRSFSVHPEGTFIGGLDTPLVGTPQTLSGEVVMERATQCAPQGWAGPLTLELETSDGIQTLICRAGRRSAALAAAPGISGKLSYSLDRGVTWRETLSNTPSGTAVTPRASSVWIRVSGVGALDVVEFTGSGRPEIWARNDFE